MNSDEISARIEKSVQGQPNFGHRNTAVFFAMGQLVFGGVEPLLNRAVNSQPRRRVRFGIAIRIFPDWLTEQIFWEACHAVAVCLKRVFARAGWPN